MLKRYFIIYFLIPLAVFSQVYVDSTSIGKKINAIYISGNHVTQQEIIQREMKQTVGDTLNLSATIEDWKRIQNLNLFNRVIIHDYFQDDKLTLNIQVAEMIYWVPYPIFYINDHDWDKFSYGAGIIHNNYRGRSESLKFNAILGYNPSTTLQYVNPWIGGNRQYYWGMSVFYRRELNKHYKDEIYENYSGFSCSFGKRFGYHLVGQLTLGYEELRFSKYIEGQTLSGGKADQLPSVSLLSVWDYRDLKEYPHSGWYFKIYGIKKGIPGNSVDYGYYGTDIRKYFPVGNTTLAFKMAWLFSAGDIPIYDRVYFGYGTRVRGYFFDQFEGENRALGSIAYHIPLLPIRYINLYDTEYLHNLKFGISAGIFADTGIIWFQKSGPEEGLTISGYGAGIHFHLPYINVLRFDLAFNEAGKIQYIVDVGVDI